MHFGGGEEHGHFSAGTLIHELTHACTRILYGDSDVPCPAPGGGEHVQGRRGEVKVMNPALAGSAYVTAIMHDAKNSSLLCQQNPDESRIYETLFGRLESDYAEKGDLALLQEYLVSVPQLIAEYGEPAVRRVAPSLVDYFSGSFADACIDKATGGSYGDLDGFINNDPLIARLDPPVVKPVQDGIPNREPDQFIDRMMDRVEDLYKAEHGHLPMPGGDPAPSHEVTLPTGSGSYDLRPDQARAFEKTMRTVRSALVSSIDPNALPETISTEILRDLVQETTHLSGQNLRSRALKKQLARKGGDFTRDVKRDFLEKSVSRGDTLENEQLAELVLIRAEDEVWRQGNPGVSGTPHPIYNQKDHDKLVGSLTRKLDATFVDTPDSRRTAGPLLNDPVALDQFINDQRDAIVAANRAMRADGDKIKISRNRAKDAWYQHLQQLTA